MAESVELPSRLAILPFRNKVLLPGAIIRIRCTSPSSVQLVEQELWQREEKGLIGILPVRDAAAATAETASVGPTLSHSKTRAGSDTSEKSSRTPASTSSDNVKLDGKHQQEVFHWHNRGVAARALHLSRGVEKPSGRVTYIVVLEGLCRFNLHELSTRGAYYTARISPLEMTKAELEQVDQDPDFVALSRHFKATAMELISVLEQKQKTGGRTKVLLETVPVHKLADIFVASFEISFEEQLSMLDSVDLKARLSKANELVDQHLQSIRVAEKITQKVEGQLSKSQKEFLLRQQMRAIKEELGDNDDDEDDVAAIERKMQSAGMPSNIWKHAQRELRRLKKMQPQQPGYNSSHVYLELLADLPWQTGSEQLELDLKAAKKRLDNDHYGLVKIKQRIIEYLAVRKLKPDARGPVLCFVGPPGVGKTSLASSIAAALGRKFVRISLGGIKDEADIRGHRRTYIGSMPGRLIDGIKRVGVCNPVMLLDEIDKTGSDVRGDPASALLEVLDPEQNKTFNDHYLNVPFDLSKVIFVATANKLQPIPPPLLDRMEVIELPGYTPEEKLRIAMQYLIPRVLDQHGLSSEFLQIPEAMVELVIQRYTREAGVRNLERNLAALARAAAVRVAEQEQTVPLSKDMHQLASPLLENRLSEGAEVEMEVIPMNENNHEISNTFSIASPLVVDEPMLEKVLGPPRFDDREAAERVAAPGISVGLVWTAFGGEVQFVEASSMVGKGELHLTGQLGDVIKESAQIALTWVRARATDLKLAAADETNLLEDRDVHIHFPAGAVPKDGPSAGVTLVTALVSLFSQKRVRADTAMTGEMTLRGLVLPVGGIKDKVSSFAHVWFAYIKGAVS
ncbi:lon protease homolog 2, peroxisomal isoform X3 [Populus trichocarpa]|uniref:lon protease homolog 2, peroxisomal isoform X3 n=1 Tax=Populus trichocarpa TaxID=3694 RepID=UPI000D188B35|nr:lon protease homolog 2, peroxisomal isoform X3 [Populus trichocarpa]|eukprot:XP_024443117.1 lon protease homolog 2, peroxisomal isoform X3 [Populus trichocarpa]